MTQLNLGQVLGLALILGAALSYLLGSLRAWQGVAKRPILAAFVMALALAWGMTRTMHASTPTPEAVIDNSCPDWVPEWICLLF